MSYQEQIRRFRPLSRRAIFLIFGGPLLLFVFGPFPGMGLVFPIWDALRGHPSGSHGTQPAKFNGLWIREEYVEFDFMGTAFGLMPDGTVAGNPGMYRMTWHFDHGRLFTDYVSLCGNGYVGNQTSAYSVKFLSPDRVLISNLDKTARPGIGGTYRRTAVTDKLKRELKKMEASDIEAELFKGHIVGKVLERYEKVVQGKQ